MGVDPPVCSVRNLASRGYETKVERGEGRYANNMSSIPTFSYRYFRYMTKSRFRRKGIYLGLCTNHGMFRQYNSNVLSQFDPIWDSTVLRNEHAILPSQLVVLSTLIENSSDFHCIRPTNNGTITNKHETFLV